MRILFIGDIVGEPGRIAIQKLVPKIIEEENIEFVVANCENAAGGSGITEPIANELFRCGIDVLTSGDHIWKHREIIDSIDNMPRLLRPANYPKNVPGAGFFIGQTKSKTPIAIINLLGRVFMNTLNCPFETAKEILKTIKEKATVILVDIHAEATSEKMAMGWFLDGEVSAVCGTHTHVQTADEKILPKGTAFITDVGMTGPYDSILGRRVEQIIVKFLTQMPTRFEMADKNVILCGVILDVDAKTGRAISIKRVQRQL